MKTVLSPKELALAIGVSESSLKRWADDGLIRVSRTAGGHRRILVSEAVRFIRESQSIVLRPDILGLPEVGGAGGDTLRGDRDADRLFAVLRDGHADEARGLLTSLYLDGHSLAAICDGPLQEAMERIGELWQHDAAGVFFEHRATDICVQGIQQLRLLLPPVEHGPAAVGGAPPGDVYTLPSLVAATALTAEGFRAVNLGPETPLDSLRMAADHHQARLVWLSLSVVFDARQLARDVEKLAAELGERGARLVVGGRRRELLQLPPGGPALVGASMAELVAFAKGLAHAGDKSERQHATPAD